MLPTVAPNLSVNHHLGNCERERGREGGGGMGNSGV